MQNPPVLQVRKASFKNTWGLATVDGEPIKESFYLVSTFAAQVQASSAGIWPLICLLYCNAEVMHLARTVKLGTSMVCCIHICPFVSDKGEGEYRT